MIASTTREPGTVYGDDGQIAESDSLGEKKETISSYCLSRLEAASPSRANPLYCSAVDKGSNREEGRCFE